MKGDPPRDPLSAAAEGQAMAPAQDHEEEDERRPTLPQPEGPRMPYARAHAPSSSPVVRKATLTGSTPPTSSTPAVEQRLAYEGAIPGPAPLPRVPGIDRLVSSEDGAVTVRSQASTTGRHRSRRALRGGEDTPAPGPPSQEAAWVPSAISEPPPEVRDDDWGSPELEGPPNLKTRDTEPARPHVEPASHVAPQQAFPGPSGPTSEAARDAPPSPLALRSIPRPAPRPATGPPSVGSPADLEHLEPGDAILPLPIINVMSDLPAVPSERPEPLDEDLEEAVEEGAVEEAALPLRLLADGPTPLDAHEYFEELEPAHDAPDEAHVDARGGIVEVEPDSFEEVEPEPRSGDAEPDSFEEVEPERDLDAGVELEPERAPESIQEIEPERDSDLGEEIPIDMVDEPEAQPLRPPLPPQPPPLRRPPALASPDLPPYSSPVPPAAAEAPVSAPPARAPGDSPAPPLAAPPPPSKPAPAAIETPPPTTDTQRRKKPWWEELFGEDFSRTMDRIEHNVVRREVDFIEERLGMEKGAVILDLACGPGQHAVEMASRGYSVVGYDLSLAMLARASDEAQERGQKLNFLQGDMRDMAFEEMFDAVYCWATSFGYFEEEKNADVLGRIHRALRSGGMLLLDVINRDYVSCRQPSLVWFEGDGCVCMDEMQVDFFTSRLKVKRTVMFEDGRSRELDYSIRIYGLHELGKLLHEAGFKVTEVTGHPAHPGVFFGSESPRLIVLAERA